jgi:hypothetical protein
VAYFKALSQHLSGGSVVNAQERLSLDRGWDPGPSKYEVALKTQPKLSFSDCHGHDSIEAVIATV